jgi:PKD repeat protein
MFKTISYILILLLSHSFVFSQNVAANFSVSDPVCQGERLLFDNQSINASSYQWDFCFNDLESTPLLLPPYSVTGSSFTADIDVVYDSGIWYGYATDLLGNRLYRLTYGASLENTIPSQTDLGNIGGLLSSPYQTRFYLDTSGVWVSFTVNSGNSRLIRAIYGNGLSGLPTMVEDLGDFSSLNTPYGITLGIEGGKYILLVSNRSKGNISLIDFGNSLTNTPDNSDVLEIGSDIGLANPDKLSIISAGGEWYILVSSVGNNNVYRINLGNTLYDSNYSFDLLANIAAVYGVELVREGLSYHALLASQKNGFYRLSFGSDMSSSPTEVFLGKVSVEDELRTLKVVRSSPDWYAFTTSRNGGVVSTVKFSDQCDEILSPSITFNPSGISYANSGQYLVELTSVQTNGSLDVAVDTITVLNQTSPDISFTTFNSCVDLSNTFSVQNTSEDITSYSWDFDGDGIEDSSDPNPTYQYVNTGSYAATVIVANGTCTNTYTDTVKIYNPPRAAFALPAGSFCTQTPISFVNETVYDQDAPVTFSWDFDGDGLADSQEASPSYTHPTAGAYNIRLIAHLAEACADTVTKSVTILEGFSVDFEWTNNCFGEAIQFNNLVIDEASYSYRWDFGDGVGSSSSRNPDYRYSEAGSYTVELTVDNGICAIPFSRELVVNADPLVGLSSGQSFQNVPTSFKGIDQTLLGDSIVSWLWDFGGLGTATTQQANFTFTVKGDYIIGLTATSALGCIDTYDEILNVEEPRTPYPIFSLDDSVCQGQHLVFENKSVNAERYVWDFCMNDLDSLPALYSTNRISGSSFTSDIELVYDSEIWHGFVTDFLGSKLYRLTYGPSLENANPLQTDLGNIGGLLNAPNQTRFYFDKTEVWIGLTVNSGSSSLIRSVYHSGLGQPPTLVENLGSFSSLSSPYGLSINEEDGAYVVTVSNRSSGKLTMIDFGSSLTNTPSPSDAIELETDSQLSNPDKFSVKHTAQGWYCLISSTGNNGVYRVNFGEKLFDTDYTIDRISSVSSVYGIELVQEGLSYYGLLASQSEGVYRLSFGENINSTPAEVGLGKIGIPDLFRSLKVVRSSPDWYGFVTSRNGGIVSSFKYSDQCEETSLQPSTAFEPINTGYPTSGIYEIGLTAYHPNGSSGDYTNTVTVTGVQGPDISFSTESNSCLSMISQFKSLNSSGDIQTYSWDFNGDGIKDSAIPNPGYQYTSVGDYAVKLTVNNGSCTNTYIDTVKIYNEPKAGFTLPAGNLCTQTPINFRNTSIYDQGAPVTFSWDFDGDGVEDSQEASPSYIYTNAGTYDIGLIIDLPRGCVDTFTIRTVIFEGFEVDFSWTNNCFGKEINFTNLALDEASYRYRWDFGDDVGTSLDRNPRYTYAGGGSYAVALIVDNGICEIPFYRSLVVNPDPLVTADIDQGIQNIPLKFKGIDQTLSGDSIVSWLWDFGGLGSSNDQEATFDFTTIGSYNIGLTTNTAQGCIDNYTELLNVEEPRTPYPVFSVDDPVCQGKNLSFNNQSVNSERYVWDFCMNDLDSLPSLYSINSINGSSFTSDIEVIYDSENWYGFVTDLLGNKLYRLTYGANLENESPSQTDLGNIGGLLASPNQTRFYLDRTKVWVALTVNSGNSRLIRSIYGSGLDAPPTLVENLGSFSSLSTPNGLSINEEDGAYLVMVSNRTGKLTMINFGSSLTNTPLPSDVIELPTEAELSNPDKFSVKHTLHGWYALISTTGNSSVYRINFGDTMFDTDYSLDKVSSLSSVFGVELIQEGLSYYGLLAGQSGGIYRLSFGEDINSTPVEASLGKIGISDLFRSLKIVRSSPDWYGFVTSRNGGIVSVFKYADQCEEPSLQSSTAFESINNNYPSSGGYEIGLTAYHPNGSSADYTSKVTVNEDQAPDISFTTDNSCISTINHFTSFNTSGDIAGYSWDFNDDGIEDSNVPIPSYQYENIGNYAVKLTVVNGACANTYIDTVKIYNIPQADFNLPAGNLCTKAPINFVNTSIYDQGAPVTFSWDFDGDGVEDSQEEAPSYTYMNAGAYDIRLIVNLPLQCADTLIIPATILEGFDVDFSWTNNCFGEAIRFMNLALDDATYRYSWEFGDGVGTSVDRNPTYTYAEGGSFKVALVVDNGTCEIPFYRVLVVNPDPLASADIDQGVQNIPLKFNGLDQTLSGDSIVSWGWDFEGLGSSAAQEAIFTFTTLANYNIELTTTTAQGCTDIYTKLLTIEEPRTPYPVFSVGDLVCQGENLLFDNQSVNSERYVWDFCMNDLDSLPVLYSVNSIDGSSFTSDIEVVYDSENWYGFVTDFLGNRLHRLTYGSSLQNENPAQTDLGNIGGLLASPNQTRFYLDKTKVWVSFTVNSGNSRLIRSVFGSGLGEPPTLVENLGSFSSLSTPYGLSINEEDGAYIVMVSNRGSGNLTLIDFGSSLTDTPGLSSVITLPTDADLSNPDKFSIMHTPQGWYCLISSTGNNSVYRINLGKTLFDDEYTLNKVSSLSSVFGVELVQEGLAYYGLLASQSGGVYHLSFNEDMNSTPVETSLGKIGISDLFRSLKMVRSSPDWYGFVTSRNGGIVSAFKYLDQCEEPSLESSNAFEAINKNYPTSGIYEIGLTAYHPNGSSADYTKTVTVTEDQSPDIRFIKDDNTCFSSFSQFTTFNTSGDITSYSWDFNDDGIEDSTDPNPIYQFTNTGNFAAKLTVVNGTCTNMYIDTVKVYNAPEADFTLPLANLCTQTSINFTNASIYDQGSPVTFSWDFDGDGLEDSQQPSPSYIYNASGSYNVRLIVSLPLNCADTVVNNIFLNEGYLVDFKWDNFCFGEETQFTNLALDDASYMYRWDFGDGEGTSTERNPKYTYTNGGNYIVKIIVENEICEIPLSRSIFVNADPLVNAAIDRGVQNVPLKFIGIDQTLSGDSIVSWLWDFGGLASSTAKEATFAFTTLGNYNIELTTTTAQGCTDNYSELLNVEQPITSYPIFAVDSSVCQGEQLIFDNQSVNAERYVWDFCMNDLDSLPTLYSTNSINGSSFTSDIEVVYDSENWYGFVTDLLSNKIYRLSYGSSLENTNPSQTDLGNIGGLLNSPNQTRFYFDKTEVWVSLTVNSGSSGLIRSVFGSGLVEPPTLVENLGSFSSLSTPYGLSISEEESAYIVMVSNRSGKITMIDFGSSLTNIASLIEVIELPTDSHLSIPDKFSVKHTVQGWYGLISSTGNNSVYRIDFGDTLFDSDYTIDKIGSIAGVYGVELVQEGLSYYGLLASQSAGVYQLSFGEDINSTPVETSLGKLGISDLIRSLKVVRSSPEWYGFVTSRNGGIVSSFKYSDQCEEVSLQSNTAFEPTNIVYLTSGIYEIGLTAYHPNGTSADYTNSLTVTKDQAPDIIFTTDNSCIATLSEFTSINNSGDLIRYSWDFNNDGIEDSTDPNPSYQFPAVGIYAVRLAVESSNGCGNWYLDTVRVYADPIAAFDLPEGVTCTNNSLVFTNKSRYTPDSPVTFSWDFDGDGEEDSAEESPSFTYKTIGTYDVRLIAGLATGCADTVTQQLVLQEGFPIAFQWSNNCFGESVAFENLTVDQPSYSYGWDFGDDSPLVTTRNASHTYSLAGSYAVSLTVIDVNCTSVLSKVIVVNDQPLASITAGEATENLPVTFVGNDLALAGDSVVSWAWDFGETGGSSSQAANATFGIPALYPVSLQVYTAQGCNFEVSDQVNVVASTRPTVQFSVPSEVCLYEEVIFTNASVNAESYQWDFCNNDLDSIPTLLPSYSVTGSSFTADIDVVYDAGIWYGFVTDFLGNRLYRLTYGVNLENASPSQTDLGNVGGLLSSPYQTRFYLDDSGVWVSFTVNSGNSRLIRTIYEDGLSETPTEVEDLGDFSSLSTPYGLTLGIDNGKHILLISNRSAGDISLIDFGNSLINTPESSDVLEIGSDIGLSNPDKLSIIADNGIWYVLVSSLANNNVYRINLGATLYDTDYTFDLLANIPAVYGVELVREGLSYQALLASQQEGLYKLSFGSDLSSIPEVKVLGKLGISDELRTLKVVRSSPKWYGFTTSRNGGVVSKVKFSDQCNEVLSSSNVFDPSNISYNNPGQYLIELIAIHANGSLDITQDTLIVLDQIAPDVSFTTTNRCVGNSNTFTAQSTSEDITSYSWNFGDGVGTSTEANPSYNFGSVGSYEVFLAISNGTCTNSTRQIIRIYPEPPIPSTTFTSLNNCANSEITVRNQTDTTSFGAAITYLYSFTNQEDTITNNHELVYQFATPGDKILTVRSIIPGCESEVFRDTITIIASPLLNFSASTVCEGDLTSFTNNSEGSQFLWDFGDGFTSTDKAPVHLYENTGLYLVELEASNKLGCTSRETREVLINTLPQADFEYDLVCEGDVVILRDVSIVEGADILAWEWYMSDELVSTTERAEVVFNNFSEQTITLIVTASNNCSSTITQNLEILAKPEIDFDIQLSCIGSESLFRDLSAGDALISRNWFVDGQALSSNEAQLSYTFPDSGDYVVALSIVNKNLCATTLSKSIRVLPEPILNFQSMNGCQSEELSIVDLSVSMEDPIISRRWILDDEVVGNGSQIFLSDLTVGVKTLTLEVTTEQGCNYSMNQPMEIFESSIASFEVSTDFGVPPFNIDLLNTSQNATTFMWYLNDSLFSTTANPQIAILEEGGYNVQLISTNADGCLDTAQTAINAAIPLMDLSIRNLTFEEDFIFLELTNSGNLPVAYIDYTVSLADGFSFEQRYSQRVDDGQTVVLKIDLNFPKSPGFICISVKSPYGTEDLNPEDNEICINIKQQASIGLPFPNPARDFSQIRFMIPEVDRMTISLVDLSGQVKYFEEYSSAVAGLNVFYIDLTSVRPGTYFFLIKYKGDTFQSRIIKQ